MRRRPVTRPRTLGRVEQVVLDHVWAHGPVGAEACRESLRAVWPMKESTIRTVLRRLEAKGFLTHTVLGRTYIYRAAEGPATVATRAVRHIIDRFFSGSAEALMVGLVADDVLTAKQLERVTAKIARQKAKGSKP